MPVELKASFVFEVLQNQRKLGKLFHQQQRERVLLLVMVRSLSFPSLVFSFPFLLFRFAFSKICHFRPDPSPGFLQTVNVSIVTFRPDIVPIQLA